MLFFLFFVMIRRPPRSTRTDTLFPSTTLFRSRAMLKGLAGPRADLTLCPTGGISEDNAAEFLAQPNVACVGGSWMVPRPWLAAGEWDKVRKASRRAAAIVAGTRSA